MKFSTNIDTIKDRSRLLFVGDLVDTVVVCVQCHSHRATISKGTFMLSCYLRDVLVEAKYC